MFKRLKKTFIGSGRSKKSTSSNSGTLLSDDSIKDQPTSLQSSCSTDQIISQEITNLGGEFGLLSIDHNEHDSDLITAINSSSIHSQTLYTTAIDSTLQQSPLHISGTGFHTMDQSCSNDDFSKLCVTALEDTFEDASDDNNYGVKAESTLSTIDPLEDCLAAFGSLSLASKPNKPVQTPDLKPIGQAGLQSKKGGWQATSPGNSPFVVFDLESDGTTVESRVVLSGSDSFAAGDANSGFGDNLNDYSQEKSKDPLKIQEKGDGTCNYEKLENKLLIQDNKDSSSVVFNKDNDSGSNFTEDDNSDTLFYDALDDVEPSRYLEKEASSMSNLSHDTIEDIDDNLNSTITNEDDHTRSLKEQSSDLDTNKNTCDSISRSVQQNSNEETFSDAAEAQLPIGSDSFDIKMINSPKCNPFETEKALLHSPVGSTFVPSVSRLSSEQTNDVSTSSMSTSLDNQSESVLATDRRVNSSSNTSPLLVDKILPLSVNSIDSEKLPDSECIVEPHPVSRKIAITALASSENVQTKVDVMAEKIQKDLVAQPVTQSHNDVEKLSEDEKTSFETSCGDSWQKEENINTGDQHPPEKGSYAINFNTIDLDSFDPFKSSKGLVNSPTEKFPPAIQSINETNLNRSTEDSYCIDDRSSEKETTNTSDLVRPTSESNMPFLNLSESQAEKFETSSDTSTIKADSVEATPTRKAIPTDDNNIVDAIMEEKLIVSIEDGNITSVTQSTEEIKAEDFTASLDMSQAILVDNENNPGSNLEDERNLEMMHNFLENNIEEEATDEVTTRGTYSVDFSNFDDPNFDPFKSKTALPNDDNEQLTEDNVSTEESGNDKNEMVTEKFIETSNHDKVQANTKTARKAAEQNSPSANTTEKISMEPITFKTDTAARSASDHIVVNDGGESPTSKGTYSIDCAKFDDPNFDPFKSTKTLSNDEDSDKLPAFKAAYTMEFDKFDDPNFDPFQSKNAMVNSPTAATPTKPVSAEIMGEKLQVESKENCIHNSSVENYSRQGMQLENVIELEKGTSKSLENDSLGVNPASVKLKNTDIELVSSDCTISRNEDRKTSSTSPLASKGTYSIDFNKFDDPNFDPFKTTKSLINDDGGGEIPADKGAYTFDSDKLEEPNFDPFQSKNAMINSPTKHSKDSIVFPATKVERTHDIVAEFDDKNIISHSKQDVSTEKTEVLSAENAKIESSVGSVNAIDKIAAIGNENTESKKVKLITKDAPDKSSKKNEPESKNQEFFHETQEPVDLDAAGDCVGLPITKGAYSIDFSKFDDPNFDPFKTKKSLVNDESDETPPTFKHTHSVDLDKFDDPNFNPFKSNKAIINSPTSEVPVVFPENEETKTVSIDKITETQICDEVTSNTQQDATDEIEDKTSKYDATKVKDNSSKLSKSKQEESKTVTDVEESTGENSVDVGSAEVHIPKGAYSVDFSKFDDPNFDPFKTTKSLTNDEGADKIPATKGAYAVDLDKFDDPNFNPFQSKKSMENSPTKNLKETPFLSAVKLAENENIAKIEDKNIANASMQDDEETFSEKKSPKKPKKNVRSKVSESSKVKKSSPFKVINPSEESRDTTFTELPSESSEPPVPKGAYSIDFSKFDDPNFDPFKTTKSLTNDEGSDEIPAAKGAYAVDLDKFDDPNFNPFQSKKAMANSPTKTSCDELPSVVAETFLENPVPEKRSVDDNELSKDVKVPKKVPKKAGKSKGKPSKIRSELAALKKKHQENLLQSSGHDDQTVEDPLPAKGAYSMDFSKFDDPSFDPFKTTKSLTNDEDGDEIPASKGAHTMDLDNFDDPNFNSFQSKKSMEKSPAKSLKESPLSSVTKDVKIDDTTTEVEDKNITDGSTQGDAQLLPKKEATKSPKKNVSSKTNKTSKLKKSLPEEVANPSEESRVKTSSEPPSESSEPLVPKGAYSIDFSKFDDPNFDPFKTTKSLTNDEGSDEIPAAKGAHTMDLDKFDDPNFNPFQSKKAMANSPTKTSCDELPSVVEETFTENPVPEKRSVDDNELSKDVKIPKKKAGKSKGKPSKIRSELAALKKKHQENLQQSSGHDDETVEDPLPAKGAYSMDFSKFDDPNFDPFKTTKSLTNDEDGDEIPAAKGAYAMDLDKFDDPNFNPFQSKKAMANSPTKTSCDELPSVVTETFPENPVPEEGSVEDNQISKETKAPKKVQKKAGKLKGKPSTIRSELAALKKKHEENLQQSSGHDDETVEDPLPAKGAYSMDFSKFDDPNFDPFQSSKNLPNDSRTNETLNSPNQPLDTTQLNDPTFKSNKAFPDSPTEKASFDSVVQQSDASDMKLLSEAMTPNISSVSNKTVLTDESNIQLGKGSSTSGRLHPRQNKKNEIRNPESPVDNFFRPADKVFNDPNSLTSWEELWDKENDNSNTAIESELRKQSLYVQFDPLVEPIPAIERAMQQNQQQTQGLHAPYTDTFDNDSNKTLTGEGLDVDSDLMASSTPPYHPAISQLAQNLVSEKWNVDSSQGSSNEALILFSPEQTARDTGHSKDVKTHYSSEESRNREEYLAKQQLLRMESEKRELDQKKEALRVSLEDMRARVTANKTTERELEKVISGLRNDLDAAHVEQRRVLDDIVSARRVYHDYHVKASELLPVLQAHKQTDFELREELDNKLKALTEKTKNLRMLKQDAETTKAKLAAEVAKARSATEREVGALQAKYKKEQMSISSLTVALQDRVRENEELTKICDELIAGAEHKS